MEWREIKDIPGREVSDTGLVRSSRRGLLKGHKVYWNGRPRCVTYTFKHEGKLISRSAHRLVLEAFIGPCPDGMEGCHGDGDGFNNALTNLRWDTHQANMADAMRHGTFVLPSRRGIHRGSTNARAQLGEADVQAVRARLAAGEKQAAIARSYGVSKHLIAHIKLGRSWRWLESGDHTLNVTV